MTFTEFIESCRSKYSATQKSPRDHEGNILLDDPKVQKQLKLHKLALDRWAKFKLTWHQYAPRVDAKRHFVKNANVNLSVRGTIPAINSKI